MNIRRSLVALLAGAIVFGTAAAAASAGNGPPVPSGCSFDPGVLTCVTTTTTSKAEGPFNTGGLVSVSTTFGDVTGVQICNFQFGGASWTQIELGGVTLTVKVTTTTTTERHGLDGKVFATQESSTQAITGTTGTPLVCKGSI